MDDDILDSGGGIAVAVVEGPVDDVGALGRVGQGIGSGSGYSPRTVVRSGWCGGGGGAFPGDIS